MDKQRGGGGPGPLAAGDPRFVGPYEITGKIGEGGMGAVYLGRGQDGRAVAVKVVRAELARDPGFVARFHDEVVNAERVASFCTAQVLDHGEADGLAYMVTEYIDGVTLLDYVRRDGALSAGMLQGVAVGVAAALVAIHSAGIIHRDLKPGNVLLSFSGPRVIDFGIARALDAASSHTLTGQLIGSPGWMAPEQVGGKPLTTAADIFAWGCLVAYAGSGRHPYGQGGSLAEMAVLVLHAEPDIGTLPAPLDRLVPAALDKDPARRPTARDLLLTLVGGTDGEAAVMQTLNTSWQPAPQQPPHPPTEVGRPNTPWPQQPPHPPTEAAAWQAQAHPPAEAAPQQPAHPPTEAANWQQPAHPPTEAANRQQSPQRQWQQPPVDPAAQWRQGPAQDQGRTEAVNTRPPGANMPYAPATRPGGPAELPRSRRRGVLVAGALVVVLAGGGAATWMALGGKSSPHKKSGGPAVAAGIPSDKMLVRIDSGAGWGTLGHCHTNTGTLSPSQSGVVTPKVLLPGNYCDFLAKWSPNRAKIVFIRCGASPACSLYTMDADGGGLFKVTDRVGGRTRAGWSPDGRQLTYMASGNGHPQIHVVDADGKNDRALTTSSDKKDDPAFSPDGRWMVFWSQKSGTQQIYTLSIADPNAPWHQVTHGSAPADDPAWCPDSKHLAYTSTVEAGTRRAIRVIGLDGTGDRAVTDGTTHDLDPAYSQDGKWVTFVRVLPQGQQVWAARADGTGARAVAAVDTGQPDW